MNPNYDANTIMANVSAQQAQPQQQPQAPHGNWFTHLLPTIGGIGGSILGGLATAGLGGEVVGGAGGAALGKGLEHALEGDKVIQGDDLTAGLEGGAGAGVGGLAGKAIGKAGEFVGNYGKGVASDAAQATESAGNLANSKTMHAIYGSSKNDVGAAQSMADSAGLDMTNPAQLHEAGKMMISNGGQTLDDVVGQHQIPISGVIDGNGQKVAPSIDDLIHSSLTNTHPLTGDKLGASRSLVLGGLGQQTDEDLLRNGYTRFLSSSAKDSTKSAASDYLNEANQLLSDVNNGGTASAHDLLEAQRLVGDKAYTMSQAAMKPSATEVTQAQAATWKDLNHNLQDMIYQHPDVSNAAQAMKGNYGAEHFGGNQKLADLFNARISGAQSGKDINGLMHDAYNLRDVGADGLHTVTNPASTGSLALAKQQVGGADVNAGPSISPLDVVGTVAAPHMNVLNKAVNLTAHVAQNPKVLDVMSRIGGLGEKLAPAAGVAVATSPNMGAGPVAAMPGSDTMGGTDTMNGNNPMQPNGVNNYIHDIQGLSILDPTHYGGMGQSVLSLAPQLQRNQMLDAQLSGMPGAYANAGGAQGGGGIMSRISSLIPGTAAHTFEAQKIAAAHELAQTLGISPEAAAGMLPGLMQNQGSANISQGILGNMQHSLAY